jgi:predicted O-methyltransferase YrrM
MPLPAALRRATPDRVRHSPTLRAIAVGTGLIPPRTLHHRGEAALLAELASAAERAVEIGVYEGASAAVLARSLPSRAELHLIDPFGAQPSALRPGQRGTAWASRRVVARSARPQGVTCVWHLAYSQDVGARWTLPIDLLFIDGDHTEQGVRRDWELFSEHVRPGGHVVFHDARAGEGMGWPGPTAVVDDLFRGGGAPGWELAAEVDRTVAARRRAAQM